MDITPLILCLMAIFVILAVYWDDIIELFKRKPKLENEPPKEVKLYQYCWQLFENAQEPFDEDRLKWANEVMSRMDKDIKDFEGFDWIKRLAYIKTRNQNRQIKSK